MNWQNNNQMETQQNLELQNMNQQEGVYGQEPKDAPTNKIISRSAIALFIMGSVILLTQILIQFVVAAANPTIAKRDWYIWAVTAFTMIGLGLPVFFFLSKGIPNSEKGEVVKLKVSHFFVIFFICIATMYITNFFSVFLTFIIAFLKGENFLDLNPLTEVFANSNYVLTLLYASIAAPIVEELIFRKILLDKLRRYGDVPAILLTGFAFGLFHMNLSQFFYATALGIIFAYVTIRTNTVRYSILLHVMINFIGASITPLVTTPNLIFSMLILLWVFTSIAIGVVLFAVNVKKIRLEKAVRPLEKKSGYLLNTGTVLYTLLCLVIMVIYTL